MKVKRTTYNAICLAGAVGAFVPTTPVVAQDDDSGWSITPYIWASDTSVDLTFRDVEGGGSVNFRDLVDVLDAAFMVQIEGGGGSWSGFGDITYLETSESTSFTLLTVDARNEQTFIDAAVAYWPSGVASQLNFFGGVRFSDFDDRYRLVSDGTEIGVRRSSNSYTDVLLGIRYRFDLSERWALLTRGDVSGGDSEGTFLLSANFAYELGSRGQNRVLFGYQYKQAEFRDGELTTEFTYSGPMAGFNFRF